MSYNFILGPVDTDSISFCKPDQSPFTEEEQNALIAEINSNMPELIQYAHDGYYETVVVIRAKNYILYDGEEVHVKGSGLKASNKELAFKSFIDEVINALVFDSQDKVLDIYNKYVIDIHNLKDISRYCVKKTITESVLNPKRTNEQKVLDCLNGRKVQMGDKIRTYFTLTGSLKLEEHWDLSNPDHDTNNLCSKLFKTVELFRTVLNMEQFPNYSLIKNERTILQDLLGRPQLEKPKRQRKSNDQT